MNENLLNYIVIYNVNDYTTAAVCLQAGSLEEAVTKVAGHKVERKGHLDLVEEKNIACILESVSSVIYDSVLKSNIPRSFEIKSNEYLFECRISKFALNVMSLSKKIDSWNLPVKTEWLYNFANKHKFSRHSGENHTIYAMGPNSIK